jgi:pilus assembly protein CpaE
MKANPLLLIIDLSKDAENAFRIAREIKFKMPHAHLILTSTETDPQTILTAMRSGAEEFLTQPFRWPDVLQSLQSIRSKIQLLSADSTQGRIITIFSNKGGVGSTTIATNLAVTLASRKERRVCVVDLVAQFGSVASFLNLEPIYTIADLVRNSKQVDPLMLDGSLIKHSSGVRVLAEPSQSTEAIRIDPSDIHRADPECFGSILRFRHCGYAQGA